MASRLRRSCSARSRSSRARALARTTASWPETSTSTEISSSSHTRGRGLLNQRTPVNVPLRSSGTSTKETTFRKASRSRTGSSQASVAMSSTTIGTPSSSLDIVRAPLDLIPELRCALVGRVPDREATFVAPLDIADLAVAEDLGKALGRVRDDLVRRRFVRCERQDPDEQLEPDAVLPASRHVLHVAVGGRVAVHVTHDELLITNPDHAPVASDQAVVEVHRRRRPTHCELRSGPARAHGRRGAGSC